MNPARQTMSMRCRSQHRLHGAVERLAVLAERLVLDHRRSRCRPRARAQGRRHPPRWRGPARSRPDSPAPSRPRSAPPCWSRGPRSGSRRASSCQREMAVIDDARSPVAAITSPSRATVSPSRLKISRRPRRPCPASTTTTMPIPQLKVRSISGSAMPPVAASQRNTGSDRHARQIDRARRARRAARAECSR